MNSNIAYCDNSTSGGVIYRSRYLRSDTYEDNMKAKRIVVSEMGTMAYPDSSTNFITKYAFPYKP